MRVRAPLRRGLHGLAAATTLWLAGCNSIAPVNPRIGHVELDHGYRVSNLLKRELGPRNNKDSLVILTFSGGGTRAAAFSYGVLEEMRRTQLTIAGVPQNMLSEVDLITGVSGGSFTALAYALYGDRLFSEYEKRFLKRDVQGVLTARALSPLNWFKLASPDFGRSELAADYYDEILFHGATFGDLLALPTPAAIVTGTDISTGARFQFSQEEFDLMCSDLGKVRLARAAATSSAVPVVLSPVTFRNYGGHCGARTPAWVEDVTLGDEATGGGRALLRYQDIQSYEDSANRPYLHVVDGGVSDNLGLRGVIEAFEELEASPGFQQQMDFKDIRRIVVVVVNSRSAPTNDWDRSPRAPGILAQALQSSNVPIDHYSFESVQLLKDIARRWADARKYEIAEKRLAGMSQAQAEAEVPALSFETIDVSFDAIEDAQERQYFRELPTSFVLSGEAVDRLRAVAGRLLRESPGYQRLLKALADDGAAKQTPPH